MSTSGIGSSTSFWQQDQSYWQQAQSNDSSLAATDSVISAISSAETAKGKGLASIANQTALNRVNSQLSAAIENILSGNTSSSSSSSTASSASSTTGTAAAPAIGTGTAVLSISTPLSTLGIRAGGTITVTAGANTTTYASTGSDTVGDLMHAINSDLVGTAAVTASLSSSGKLVLTSKNDTDEITVGGTYASNIGFGSNNDTFKPTAGTAKSSSTPAATSTSTASTSSTTAASTKKSYTTLASETSSSAASVLSDSGVGGSLVDMLA
jgi:hypothetical protein